MRKYDLKKRQERQKKVTNNPPKRVCVYVWQNRALRRNLSRLIKEKKLWRNIIFHALKGQGS